MESINEHGQGQQFDIGDGWNRYQRLVLFRLNEQATKLDNIDAKVEGIQLSVALLKFKMGMIGAAAGMLATLLTEVVLRAIKL